MTDPPSIATELIRYRIEKRMAGRRDLLLHLLVYVSVAILFRLSVPWFTSPLDYLALGGIWAISLLAHVLRYFYCCGPGVKRRADEIERAIDEQRDRAALDEDEEILIEDSVSRRVAARRALAAHGLASFAFVTIYVPYLLLVSVPTPWLGYHIQHILSLSTLALALHTTRFFFVHGRSPFGRALKIDAEIARIWQRARPERFEMAEESAALDLGELSGRRLRLSAEGELEGFALEAEDSAERGIAR